MRSASLSVWCWKLIWCICSQFQQVSRCGGQKQNKKKSNKFKDEFKIFHKFCSSQVKGNLQYSQDFVASTILLDYHHHSCEQSKNSQKNSQQTISYPILPASREYLSIPSSVQLLPYLAQYITLQLSTRTTLYFGVWQVLIFFQFTTTCPLLFSNIIKILQEFGSDLLENFNNYTHCRFEPMTCAWRKICFKKLLTSSTFCVVRT